MSPVFILSSFRGGVDTFYPKGFQWQKCHRALQLCDFDFCWMSGNLYPHSSHYPNLYFNTCCILLWYKGQCSWNDASKPTKSIFFGGDSRSGNLFGELFHPKMLWGFSPWIQWFITIFPFKAWLLQGYMGQYNNPGPFILACIAPALPMHYRPRKR